jgi:carbon-monoxide dehydrogenase medium subunit
LKPAPFEYHALPTLDDALRLKASLHNAKVMASGQSLMFILNMRFALSAHVIDLNPLAELCYIRRKAGALKWGLSNIHLICQKL